MKLLSQLPGFIHYPNKKLPPHAFAQIRTKGDQEHLWNICAKWKKKHTSSVSHEHSAPLIHAWIGMVEMVHGNMWSSQKKIHNNYTCLQDICLHRLVVRTSRCGRDNPGSTPGGDIYHILAHACMGHPTLSIWRFPQNWSLWDNFNVRLFQCLIQVRVSTKNGFWKLGLGFLKLRGFLFWTRIITYILN